MVDDSLLSVIYSKVDMKFVACHFWTNFEIADADFWRSPEYTEVS
jgi:alpha 1,2-mannosyltransferase